MQNCFYDFAEGQDRLAFGFVRDALKTQVIMDTSGKEAWEYTRNGPIRSMKSK
jgi:hypothetical protein